MPGSKYASFEGDTESSGPSADVQEYAKSPLQQYADSRPAVTNPNPGGPLPVPPSTGEQTWDAAKAIWSTISPLGFVGDAAQYAAGGAPQGAPMKAWDAWGRMATGKETGEQAASRLGSAITGWQPGQESGAGAKADPNPYVDTEEQVAAGKGIPILSIPGGPSGWRRTVSPSTDKLVEEAFDETQESRMEDIGYMRQGENRAEAIRQAARQKGEDQMNEQIGQAQGKYFTAVNELQKAQQLREQSQAEADRAIEEVHKAKIDPTKFFSDRDVATNIGIALSTAMGAFWSVFTGRNEAQEIIDKAIARDIDAQTKNLSNKQSYASMALRKNFEKTQDLNLARELTRLQMLEVTRLQAHKMAMDQQSAVEQANHEKVMAGLDGAINKTLADIDMKYAEYRMRSEQFVSGAPVGGNLLEQGVKNYARYVPGLGVIPGERAEDVSNLKKQTATAANLQRTLNQIAAVVKEVGIVEKNEGRLSALRSPEMQRLEALTHKARFMTSQALDQGVIRKEEANQFDKLAGDPLNEWVSADQTSRVVQSLANDTNNWLQDVGDQWGAVPAEIAQMQDKTGMITPVAITLAQTPQRLNRNAFNTPAGDQSVDATRGGGIKLGPMTPKK